MQTLPLNMRLGRENTQLFLKREHDPAFAKFADRVKQRDNHTCRFCSFQSVKCMRVVNIDHNYRNNVIDNLATACPFCVQSMFIEAAGQQIPGGGKVLYLPGMTQGQLNALCHVLYAAVVNGSQYAAKSDAVIKSLKLRTVEVEKKYGKGMSNPTFMGRMLIDAPVGDSDRRASIMLEDLRLLPSLKCFEKDILEWAQQAQMF